jgi:hypothetical protein
VLPIQNPSLLIAFIFLTSQTLTFNLLKPSDNFTYDQVDIKKFYVVPTLRLCVLYGSQNKQQLLPYKTFCTTELEGVYCAVRTQSLHKTDVISL